MAMCLNENDVRAAESFGIFMWINLKSEVKGQMVGTTLDPVKSGYVKFSRRPSPDYSEHLNLLGDKPE